MYRHRHAFVEVLQQWVVAHKQRLSPDDILVETDGGPCLGINGCKIVNLCGRLVDKREHDIEGNAVLTEQLRTHLITVVSEIACPYGRKMEIATVVGRQLADTVADGACKFRNG